MIAIAVLCKEFLRWSRDGAIKHVFNPSAIGLFLFSVGLILSNNTHITWGKEIAETLRLPPYIYIELFCLGLVVQALFSVTLVTLSAATALYFLNLAFTRATGVYYFIDSGISVSLFLGLHLLVTDPATSPRTTIGRILFGGLYGGSAFAAYGLLALLGIPIFYDKLLPVPALNLTVRALDYRATKLAAFFSRWSVFDSWKPRSTNLAFMALWSVLFLIMTATGFLSLNHPSQNIQFWQQACEQHKWNSCAVWFGKVRARCGDRSADDCVAAGEAVEAGLVVPTDRSRAGELFMQGCELGSHRSCSLLRGVMRDHGEEDLLRECDRGDAASCWTLGLIYGSENIVVSDPSRAIQSFTQSCMNGWLPGCARVGKRYLAGEHAPLDSVKAAAYFDQACKGDYAPSCYDLAIMYAKGIGVSRDMLAAGRHRKRACALGVLSACQFLERTE